jgi:hypothetical protein
MSSNAITTNPEVDRALDESLMREALRLRRSRASILLQTLVISVFVIVMNQVFELKDREVYEYYFESLGACQWVGCFLISDSVRSPVFLSLIIGGQRIGLDFDLTFTFISLLSVFIFARSMRALPDPMAGARMGIISIALGVWLYLIQVKLFLAIALCLAGAVAQRRWLRIVLLIASVLTHESIAFFIVLQFLWRPSDFRIGVRGMIVIGIIVALLATYLGATSNVFLSAIERWQRYNVYVEVGDVPTMSRVGMYSILMLAFGMISLFRFRPTDRGTVSFDELKILVWMFLPWLVFMVFAGNAVFATRLSELALLHTLLVMPFAANFLYASRISLLTFALTFGLLTLVRDVLLA